MTLDQQIISEIKQHGRLLRKLVKQMKADDAPKKIEWLTAEQIKSEFDISKKYLQLKRRQGVIKNYRCLTSGKNFQYQRSEIENLFTTIKQ